MKVMIVEDSQVVRHRLAELIVSLEGVEDAGWAADGGEALRLFRARSPEVVLLDLHLAGGSGLDVLRQIRAESSSCVVIVFTQHTQPEFRAACLEGGADFFLSKYYDYERLPAILEELVRRSSGGLRPSGTNAVTNRISTDENH